MPELLRLASDKANKALTHWLARVWDFIDSRDIDKHAMAWLIAWCGWDLTRWAMSFAEHHPKMAGSDVALVVAAVGVPYGIFAGAVVKWYFERKDT
jgi:hypothetical protein